MSLLSLEPFWLEIKLKCMENLKVTIVQQDIIWQNPDQNLLHLENILASIGPGSTNLIVMPEMFTTGFTMSAKENATTMDGPILKWMQKLANSKQAYVCGSLIIQEPEGCYNRFILSSDAKIEGYYDKKHLFRMSDENLHFLPGRKSPIFNIGNWHMKALICYDLRFPVWARNTNNYDILVYVANWPASRAAAWTTLLQARALENQAYVIGVNRVGTDGQGLKYTGNSAVVNPRGEIISTHTKPEEFIETIELDGTMLQDFRAKFPAWLDADSFQILD